MGIKLGLSKETMTEVVESCKDEEEQLKEILQHWQKEQGDTKDPAVLKQALDGLEPQSKFFLPLTLNTHTLEI